MFRNQRVIQNDANQQPRGAAVFDRFFATNDNSEEAPAQNNPRPISFYISNTVSVLYTLSIMTYAYSYFTEPSNSSANTNSDRQAEKILFLMSLASVIINITNALLFGERSINRISDWFLPNSGERNEMMPPLEDVELSLDEMQIRAMISRELSTQARRRHIPYIAFLSDQQNIITTHLFETDINNNNNSHAQFFSQPIDINSRHLALDSLGIDQALIPERFICPISHLIIEGTPCYLPGGASSRYDSKYLNEWLSSNSTDPCIRATVSAASYKKDIDLETEIESFVLFMKENHSRLKSLQVKDAQEEIETHLTTVRGSLSQALTVRR